MTIKQAMILAAGLGTRMRPITLHTPKPLVKIAGKPMIDYALDALKQAGVEQCAVNIHHHGDQMLAHLAHYKDMAIRISDERDQLMNSGGGLVKGLKLLSRDPVFVMNADLFWINEKPDAPTNFERLGAFFDPEIMDMALLCVKLENTTGHNGTKDFHLDDAGRLKRYQSGDCNPVVYAGAIALSPLIFDNAPKDAFNLNVVFDQAIQRQRLFGLVLDGHWLTVGTPEAIDEAETTIRRFQS